MKFFMLLTAFVGLASALPPLPPSDPVVKPRATNTIKGAQQQMMTAKQSFVVAHPLTNYMILTIGGVDPKNGQPGYPFVPIDLQGTLGLGVWTNTARFWTNQDITVAIPTTDPPHRYRWFFNQREIKPYNP